MAPVVYHSGSFPPSNIDWPTLIPLIGPANRAIARYDGTLGAIPNAAVLLSPLTTQEAVLSSRIEGTQATMGEVLEYEAEGDRKDIGEDRKADINEVLNYRRAMFAATDLLKELPLSQRVLKQTHQVLLDGVRGQGKSPGEYRRIPNWIGPPGCTIDTARFVPISADQLPEGMSRWERYIHDETPDQLVQLAVLHAEFEALHPFLDGNGRLGRMFVPLFMFQKGLIQSPMFYISAFFETHRDEYYERLLAVSRDGDWTGWCRFFLTATTEQARENQQKASEILSLYEEMKQRIVAMTHSQYAILALDWLFARPIFRSADFVESGGIPRPTARRILTVLKDETVIIPMVQASGRRSAVFAFRELLNLAEGKAVF